MKLFFQTTRDNLGANNVALGSYAVHSMSDFQIKNNNIRIGTRLNLVSDRSNTGKIFQVININKGVLPGIEQKYSGNILILKRIS
tara:strand:+ start:7142 stop:7396 length:255 start_codon:yes stop_codon:yes gene_type:complete